MKKNELPQDEGAINALVASVPHSPWAEAQGYRTHKRAPISLDEDNMNTDTNKIDVTNISNDDINPTENYEYITGGRINPNVLPPFVGVGIEEAVKKKICPWQIENLSHIYNLKRFPDRKRREPKKLRKFSKVGNLAIVTALLLTKTKYRQSLNCRDKAIAELREYIDIKVKTFETKLSQLNSCFYGDAKKREKAIEQISDDLFRTYKMFKDVDCDDLVEMFKEHEIYGDELKTAFINLRERSLKI